MAFLQKNHWFCYITQPATAQLNCHNIRLPLDCCAVWGETEVFMNVSSRRLALCSIAIFLRVACFRCSVCLGHCISFSGLPPQVY